MRFLVDLSNAGKLHECFCKNEGKDDGDTTCFLHHDCSLGHCTHWDVDVTEVEDVKEELYG